MFGKASNSWPSIKGELNEIENCHLSLDVISYHRQADKGRLNMKVLFVSLPGTM